MMLLGGITSYPDEVGTFLYETQEERAVIEFVKRETGLKVREVCTMLSELIKLSIWTDPIIATGPKFDLSLGEIPHPYANVSLEQAFEVAREDAEACQKMLEMDGSVETLVTVLARTIRWLRFWEVRARSQELRDWYAEVLQDRLDGLEELKMKATFQFRLGLLEELSSIA
jgi:hypothetical protein